MADSERKSLDQLSDESEKLEKRFEALASGGGDDSRRTGDIADIKDWLRQTVKQGRFLPPGSPDRRALKSLLEYWNLRLRRQGLELEGVDRLAEFDPTAGVVLVTECPYPGLEPYTEGRRGFFFGREDLVSAFVTHLEGSGSRILLIIGGSGSGKSSLALAGVVPRLAERHAGEWLFGPRLTPGAHPLAELAAAIAQALGRPAQASDIGRGLLMKPDEALRQLGEWCEDRPLMLLIDQFEELLTLCTEANEQRAFAQLLCALSNRTASAGRFSCRILLTLRTDHLARFENSEALKALHMRLVGEDNERYLSAIGFGDIKRAIKEPAEAVGLRFVPPALIDQLASQTAGLSNGLPLLQFALRRLWHTRPTNKRGEPLDLITEDMVKALPDVQRALGTVAEGLFQTFSESQRRICDRLLLELVVLDESFEEPLRRRRSEAELREVLRERFSVAADIDRVIDVFVAAGLLRRFGKEADFQLEVAHEALLRHWDHIYRLVTGAEIKEWLLLIKQIEREASDWVAHERTNGYLSLTGERLNRALAYSRDGWLAEGPSRDYLEACGNRQAEEKLIEQQANRLERFQRYTWRVALLAVVLSAIVLGWEWYKSREESSGLSLAMDAEGVLDQDSGQRSLLLALEAARHSKRAESGLLPGVERALRSAVRTSSVRASIKSYGGSLIYEAAAYNPDGSVLALGDSLGEVSLWNVATGLERRALFAHVGAVRALTFSHDGRKIASGSDDGRVIVWNVESGRPLQVLSGHVDTVKGLAFSRPDGRQLATASRDGSVRLWDVSTGTQIRTLYGHVGPVRALAFGRDEGQLATLGKDGRVVVWDAVRGRVLYSVPFKPDTFDLDLSADGSLLAIAAGETVEIWDTATRSRRTTLAGYTSWVLKVRFSRDQQRLATSSYDGTVRVWELPDANEDSQRHPKEIARFSLEATRLTSLAFSPTGDTVAATAAEISAPGRRVAATIWNLASGGELLTLRGFESPVTAVAFSPDGKTITATASTGVRTWDLSGKPLNTIFKNTVTEARAAAFSRDGALAIAAGAEVLIAQPGASAPRHLSSEDVDINDLAFSPDGSRLVSGNEDGTAMVWDVPSGKRLGALASGKSAGAVLAVAYSADGKTIVTGGEDHTIRLWRADTRELLRELTGHAFGIVDLAFTTDGRKLVSGSLDKTVRVWDVATGSQEDVLQGHTDVVTSVAINGNHLATAADDGIRLWDLSSRAPIAVFPARAEGGRSLAFSPDGRYLAAGRRDGIVRVYAMHAAELVQLAETRVQRGWTNEECKQFLQRPCAQSRYSLLDEAYRHFEKLELKGGEQLLRQAKTNADATVKAEVDRQYGTWLLWLAGEIITHPENWAELVKSQKPEIVAGSLLSRAKQQSRDLVFDPQSRLNDLKAYKDVEDARSLARAGKLEASVRAFEAARAAGWQLSAEPGRVASQLAAVEELSDAVSERSESKTSQAMVTLTQHVEHALKLFPDIRSGHEFLADLYAQLARRAAEAKDASTSQNQYRIAGEHFRLAASSSELAADPLASLAVLSLDQYYYRKDVNHLNDAVKYAKQSLDRDRRSDKASYVLGWAEAELKNDKKAVEAFDEVSPSSEEYYARAMNWAAAIYFDKLKDNTAAYQRYTWAMIRAPNDLTTIANYAEFLLASGRVNQAKLAAARALQHPDAQRQDAAHLRAAMGFMLLGSELLSGERAPALSVLDTLERNVRLSGEVARTQPNAGKWTYKGIRRALSSKYPGCSPEVQRALLRALDFVESYGRTGTLSDIRALLGRTRPISTM
jgi:WD40 repeat protein